MVVLVVVVVPVVAGAADFQAQTVAMAWSLPASPTVAVPVEPADAISLLYALW